MSLIENVFFNQKCVRISPNRCTSKNNRIHSRHKRETSFCICQKGSLTVEAAVVIPFMMGFFVCVLFFFRVIFIQEAVEEALVYTGRRVAVESALTDSEEALFVSAEGLLKYKLSQNQEIKRYVVGGVLGVSLLGSDMTAKEIQLTANYMVKLPIAIFGQKEIWLMSKNSFVKWKGDLYWGTNEKKWVYITETGSVYHKDTNCRSLDLHIRKGLTEDMNTYRGSDGQRYSSCNRCIEKGKVPFVVYFTDYGKLYHAELSCSALKRTIIRVLLSEVGDKRGCRFCYE